MEPRRVVLGDVLPDIQEEHGQCYIEDEGGRIPLGWRSRVMRDDTVGSRLEALRDVEDESVLPAHRPQEVDKFRQHIARRLAGIGRGGVGRLPEESADGANAMDTDDQSSTGEEEPDTGRGPRGKRTRFERQRVADAREARRRAKFPEPLGSDHILEPEPKTEAPPAVRVNLLPPAERRRYEQAMRVFGEIVTELRQYAHEVLAIHEPLAIWKTYGPQLAKPNALRRVMVLRNFLLELVEVPIYLNTPVYSMTMSGRELLVSGFFLQYEEKLRADYFEPYRKIPLQRIMANNTLEQYVKDFLRVEFRLEVLGKASEAPGCEWTERVLSDDVDLSAHVPVAEELGQELRRLEAQALSGIVQQPIHCRILGARFIWYNGKA